MHKKIQSIFGPVVLSAIGNIYTNTLFYYLDSALARMEFRLRFDALHPLGGLGVISGFYSDISIIIIVFKCLVWLCTGGIFFGTRQ